MDKARPGRARRDGACAASPAWSADHSTRGSDTQCRRRTRAVVLAKSKAGAAGSTWSGRRGPTPAGATRPVATRLAEAGGTCPVRPTRPFGASRRGGSATFVAGVTSLATGVVGLAKGTVASAGLVGPSGATIVTRVVGVAPATPSACVEVVLAPPPAPLRVGLIRSP